MVRKRRNTLSSKSEYDFSQHAWQRMAQRNLSSADVRFVIQHGQRLHRTGVVFFFLGYDDIPVDRKKNLSRLEGTTVLMNYQSRQVVTVYRNRNGLRRIKRKSAYTR